MPNTRMSLQVPPRLREELNAIAARDHGGKIQTLLRWILQDFVDRSNAQAAPAVEGTEADTGHAPAEILEAIDRLRADTTDQTLEMRRGVNTLSERTKRLDTVISEQRTDIMEISDHFRNSVNNDTDQRDAVDNVARQLALQKDAIEAMTKQLALQSEAIATMNRQLAVRNGETHSGKSFRLRFPFRFPGQ